ncbi:MAG: aldose epimerase family protein [Polyangiaceae bacterium]
MIASTTGCASNATDVPSATSPAAKPVSIQRTPWGSVDGKQITLFTLTNRHGLELKVLSYGGIITELRVPDRHGKFDDIVLGFDDLESYREKTPYFGAIIGRVANRISGARFALGGKEYLLASNDGKNSLHGGRKGWDKVVWDAAAFDTPAGPAVQLSYLSKDGDEGFPGTVNARNTYTLTHDNELKVEMEATTDSPTVINMAHHTYWNLAGQASGPVFDQEMQIDADEYTPVDPLLNTQNGRVEPVAGTPFDFRTAKPLGRDLKAAGGNPPGFDTNWIVRGEPHALRRVLRAKDPKSGRVLTLQADQPGVQLYTGNFLDGTLRGKGGTIYQQYGAFCIETQRFPNSINVPAWRSEVVLEPGQVYVSTMVHTFSVE